MKVDFLINMGLLFGLVSAISYMLGLVEGSVNGLSLTSVWTIGVLLVAFPTIFVIVSIPFIKRKKKRR